MNKERRTKLKDFVKIIEQAKNCIQDILSEEEFAYDSLSEGLQCTSRGEQMESNIDEMEGIIDNIDNIIEQVENIY
jgi:hypothetical protein